MAVNTSLDQFSMTRDMRQFIFGSAAARRYDALAYDESKGALLDSVSTVALQHGLTLKDYVQQDPEKALMTAQLVLKNWENIRNTLALTGIVNGEKATREMTQMVDKAVQDCKNDIMHVQMIIDAGADDWTRKDRIIEKLYNQALKGDTKSAIYFIDRVEGKIPEAKLQETDYNSAGLVYAIVHSLFHSQLEVLNSGFGTKIACCSRRAGKSHLAAAILLIESLRTTNCTSMFIGETMKLADGILDKAMQQIITDCDLRDSKGNRLNWRRLENGSEILVRGLSNTKDPDQIRGHKCKVIVIDEFFHLKSDLLEYMIGEVLEPMQLDYADDYKLLFIGTPPKTRGTYGEKAWEELNVPHFTWTWQDNPYIKNGEEYIANKAEQKGLALSSPEIRREYYAEWVYDEDALLYPVYKTWKQDSVPRYNIDRVYFGIDYGISDNDAIIGIAWDTQQRRGFQFFESKFNRLTTPKDVTQWEYLKAEAVQAWEYALDFWPGLDKKAANNRISWSADTDNGHMTEEFQYNVKCRYPEITMQIGIAHKHDAMLMQDKIRELLRTGNLLLMDGGMCVQECELTILKRDLKGNITTQIDDKNYHPDLLPALRYAMWDAIGLEILDNGRSVQDSANIGAQYNG